MLPYRRYLYSFGALLCLAALMAACGGASPAPGETPSPAGAEQTGSPTEPAAATAQPPATEFTSPLPQGQSPLPTPTDATQAQAGEQPAKPELIEPVPTGPAPITGEVPQDLLDAVFDDLMERLDAGREEIVVEQAEYIIWRDGSLGCPQPGMMYTQALVPGYRIVLVVGDETFDYHANERGHFVLCEAGMAEDGLPPGDGSGPLVDQ
jgi:hypothetical protein